MGVGGQVPHSGHFIPRKTRGTFVQKAVLAPGTVWMCGEYVAPTGI